MLSARTHRRAGQLDGDAARVRVEPDGTEAFVLGGAFANGELAQVLPEERVMRRLAPLEQTLFQVTFIYIYLFIYLFIFLKKNNRELLIILFGFFFWFCLI